MWYLYQTVEGIFLKPARERSKSATYSTLSGERQLAVAHERDVWGSNSRTIVQLSENEGLGLGLTRDISVFLQLLQRITIDKKTRVEANIISAKMGGALVGHLRTYVINMDREPARLDWMTKQLQKYDVPFERFSGVDGSKLAADAQLYHQSNLRSHLSTAEIGCLLSHLGVWQTFLKTDSDYALIFEDDVHFAADFSVFLKRLRGILDPSEANVHRLEAFNARITVERGITAKIGDRFCRKMISNQGGAAAYVLNRRTAERLVSMKSQMRHLPDTEMFDPTRRATLGLAIYQWLPAPCIQDMLHDERIGLASALAGTRSDERLGILKSPNTISEPLRRLFRPAYTFFYDLLLWPWGLSRKDSKFG